jgi:hypothetical protein
MHPVLKIALISAVTVAILWNIPPAKALIFR